MIYRTCENLVVIARRNVRMVGLCVCMLVLGAVFLGIKLSHNQATAAAKLSYAQLQATRGNNDNSTLSRPDFRQALKQLVRSKTNAINRMQGRDIRLLFGNPQQVRRDHGIHVWQYSTDDCLIDIYMREISRQGAKLQAAHHEMRKRRLIKVNSSDKNRIDPDALTAAQQDRCLGEIFRNDDPDHGGQNYASLEE